ncbi:hypothetical protein M8756_16640 [Lutimaribacter sp. EGI FJ00015]|nr:hypothetical protein [Lutimaribacter sp. EGI FJ00015]
MERFERIGIPSGQADKAQHGKDDDDCADDINDLTHVVSFRLIGLNSQPTGVAGRNDANACGARRERTAPFGTGWATRV